MEDYKKLGLGLGMGLDLGSGLWIPHNLYLIILFSVLLGPAGAQGPQGGPGGPGAPGVGGVRGTFLCIVLNN